MTKEIQLTQGKVALVDDEDYEFLSQFKWQYQQDKQTGYAKRAVYLGGGRKNAKWKVIMMHKVVMNAEQTQKIDHKDGNGLNNTKLNLRKCSSAENMRNSKKRSVPTSSRFKGVSFKKSNGLWQSSIGFNYKRIYLGYFLSEIDAAKAYNKKAEELFGEFAAINKIDET